MIPNDQPRAAKVSTVNLGIGGSETMAHQAKKTEHAGAKKGKGAYWGRKVDAKKESRRVRREADKKSVVVENDGPMEGINE